MVLFCVEDSKADSENFFEHPFLISQHLPQQHTSFTKTSHQRSKTAHS